MILNSIADKGCRKEAMSEMLKLAHDKFPKVEEEVVRMKTDDSVRLCNLYKEKLELIEAHNIALKDMYCCRIHEAFRVHTDCLQVKGDRLRQIQQVADAYTAISEQDVFRGMRIDPTTRERLKRAVHSECGARERLVNIVFEYHMRMLRHELQNVGAIPVLDTAHVDECIRSAEIDFPDMDAMHKMQRIFRQNLRNIDHDIAEQLATESLHWVRLLTVSDDSLT